MGDQSAHRDLVPSPPLAGPSVPNLGRTKTTAGTDPGQCDIPQWLEHCRGNHPCAAGLFKEWPVAFKRVAAAKILADARNCFDQGDPFSPVDHGFPKAYRFNLKPASRLQAFLKL